MTKVNPKEVSARLIEIARNEDLAYTDHKDEMFRLCMIWEKFEIKEPAEIKLLIEPVSNLAKIRNRKASYIELYLLEYKLVQQATVINFDFAFGGEESADERIKRTEEEQEEHDRQMSEPLIEYAIEVLTTRDGDKSARTKKRQVAALGLLERLQNYFEIEDVKYAFLENLETKYDKLQYAALSGLEAYYLDSDAEPLTDEEAKKLEAIISSTKIRSHAYISCQILVSAGKIDYAKAQKRMDKWQKRVFYNH